MRGDGGISKIFIVDVLAALLLVLLAVAMLESPRARTAPAIETFGAYAVVINWPASRDDDVDLYVRDPAGEVVFFSRETAGIMHLERDDLGLTHDSASGVTVRFNGERVVLRGVVSGEYTVNVHAYLKRSAGPTPVDVRVVRLLGADEVLLRRQVELLENKQELTVMRFTLDHAGELIGTSDLRADLVATTYANLSEASAP